MNVVKRVNAFLKIVSHVLKEAKFNCITQGSKFFLRQMATKWPYGLAAWISTAIVSLIITSVVLKMFLYLRIVNFTTKKYTFTKTVKIIIKLLIEFCESDGLFWISLCGHMALGARYLFVCCFVQYVTPFSDLQEFYITNLCKCTWYR